MYKDLLLSPQEFGYGQNIWDGSLLSYHLEVRQCHNVSTVWASLYKDLDEKQPKLILKNRKSLKKILKMDERFSDPIGIVLAFMG